MGERKVLNKYFPPDFDPSLLPRTTRPKNQQQAVRLMLPMSIQCLQCGEYLHKGKKFNGRKEEVKGEDYLGLKIWRLYFKCSTCLSEITFKTDPQHADYTVERGAARNFEPWKQASEEERLERAKKEREEKGDAMKVLENRSEQSARELAIDDAIEEVRELNARAQALDTEQLLDRHVRQPEQLEEEQIEAAAAAAFAQRGAAQQTRRLPDPPDMDADADGGARVLRRLPDPKDLTDDDAPVGRGGGDLLGAVQLPDSPRRGGNHSSASSSAHAASAAAAAASSSSFSLASASPSSALPVSLAPSAAAVAPLAGLVLLKKRKNDDVDAEAKAARKAEKKARKEAKKVASTDVAPVAPAPAAEPPAEQATGTGLGGLLGAYDSD